MAGKADKPYQIRVSIDAPAWKNSVPDCVALCERAAAAALNAKEIYRYTSDLEVNILLSDDARIRLLNQQYRDSDKPTNVLSFPAIILNPDALHELKEDAAVRAKGFEIPLILGDIIVAYETCIRECETQNKKLSDHLQHLIVHSTLHLLGYDHMIPKQAEIMEDLETTILEGLGIDDPYYIIEPIEVRQ